MRRTPGCQTTLYDSKKDVPTSGIHFEVHSDGHKNVYRSIAHNQPI